MTLSEDYPHLAKEWSSDNSRPFDSYTKSSRYRAIWKCTENDKHPQWQTGICARTGGTKCPYCRGNKVCKVNSLGYLNPELAKEWSDKNEKTPFDYTFGSGVKVWWRCLKNSEHPNWEASICNRNRLHSSGCSYCNNSKLCKVNSFGYLKPELAKEWSERNEKSPFEYLPSVKDKVWWKCLKDDDHPEWYASLNNRSRGSGCPSCNKSRGEEETEKILKELNYDYKREKIFNGKCLRLNSLGYTKLCKDKCFLRYDFCLFFENKIALIEYHGIQHYRPFKFFGGQKKFKIRLRHDHMKRVFASNNDIPLLEISYQDDLEKVLKEFLASLKET